MGSTVGSKNSGSGQSFGHLHCRTMEEKYGLPFCVKCNHAQESHTVMSIFFSAIFAGPLSVEIRRFCYHGKVT